ncbi:hypothetical protein DPMN_154206 [Dreissena polymorpha]|uniref:Nephrocystin 3-like N-terminal domain-containing protein n=1 Tax=Dreissena polymorpha TaxID=45954 RepID=A0A9D4JA50_DREPO|nr:hypothetical protein DPMN_154206 [Dreissena polymorpha]
MEETLRTKEAQNWLKCMLAMYKTRDAISELASGLFEKFYIHIRGILHDDHHISVQKTCTTCRDPKQGCSVCSKICHLIWDSHRFKDVNLKGPSWNNTDSTQWCTSSWELAKCYMPSTGYKDKPSADNTDFNGIINALYNCIWMQNFFADDLRLDNNICTEARKQVNKLRHIHSTNIADDGMISFFDCLLNLLNDARHLKGFKPAVDARIYLIKLKQDTLQVSEKMINDTMTKHYEDKKEEFRIDLIEHYRKTKSTVSISPMTEGLDKHIVDVFVSPILMHTATEKNGCRRQTGNTVKQYKHIFFNDSTHHNKVFIQGEPGMGKTTFCAKLVLDWCEAVSSENHEYRPTFSDLETLKEFGFLFSIALRDSEGQNEVVKMIKTQIIDMIYTENERTDFYNLLQNIMKNELCIVVMDGLNEWVDPSKKHVTPIMVSCHKKCVALISTRPWKMTDERIKDSEIDLLLEVAGITDSDELTKNMLRCLQNANQKTYTDFMTYVEERQLLQFLASPWLQSLLVNLWMDNTALSGSLCELNCLLLDRLFKKANAKQGYFPEEHPIQCFFKYKIYRATKRNSICAWKGCLLFHLFIRKVFSVYQTAIIKVRIGRTLSILP